MLLSFRPAVGFSPSGAFDFFSHTVLAVPAAPMAIATFVLALRGSFERHRRLARWTFPVWLYVSVTGVIIYVMLYQAPGATG